MLASVLGVLEPEHTLLRLQCLPGHFCSRLMLSHLSKADAKMNMQPNAMGCSSPSTRCSASSAFAHLAERVVS